MGPIRFGAQAAGFSMVELLVATAILGVLAALAATAVNSTTAAANKVRELSAGRQLITAYLQAASDTGQYLPGYDRTVGEVEWPDGTLAHGPSANRYPFRLGSYLDYQLDGVILVNENMKQIDRDDIYSVSLSPAFGINYLFVGGDRAADGTLNLADEVATRSAVGENLLVFATAARRYGDALTQGFNLLTPPRTYGSMWVAEKWKPEADPGDYGHLHARHGDKSLCAFLDGSVRLVAIEELRDMRLWSRRAAQANDPNYTVPPAAPPPGSGRR